MEVLILAVFGLAVVAFVVLRRKRPPVFVPNREAAQPSSVSGLRAGHSPGRPPAAPDLPGPRRDGDSVAQLPATPTPVPPMETDRSQYVSERTNHPPPPQRQQTPPKAGVKLSLSYADVDGVFTEREITLIEIEGRMAEGIFWPNLLHAWCHLRGDNRHFAVSRIQALTDKTTGEIYEKKPAITGFLRIIAPGDMATPDDRRFTGYRELDMAARDRVFLSTRPVVYLTWQSARSRAKPKRRKATVNSVCKNRLGEPYGFWVENNGNSLESESPYFLFPDGSGVRKAIQIEDGDSLVEGASIQRWLADIEKRGRAQSV